MERTVRSRGFTLIELLVVIGIISVLASVVLVNVQRAQERGNDAARLANLNDMRVALRLYAAANGHYPITRTGCTSLPSVGCTSSTWIGYGGSWSLHQAYTSPTDSTPVGTLQTLLAPYISQPVKDPTYALSSGTDAGYLYMGDGTSYCLMAFRVPQNMHDFDSNLWDQNTGWMHACGTVNAAGQCSSGINAVYYSVVDPSDSFAVSSGWNTGC